MLAGLNPAQGLIFMLQALGGGLISKDMAMRELPFTVNVTQELEKIEIEKLRDGLLSALSATAQAIPQMASQGQDPSSIIKNIASVIQARQNGKALEDAIADTFAPEPQVPPAGVPGTPVEQPSPVPGGAPVGGAPSAGPQAPPPDVMSLISGLTGTGAAQSRVSTSRRR
jgi:hypothetical protein